MAAKGRFNVNSTLKEGLVFIPSAESINNFPKSPRPSGAGNPSLTKAAAKIDLPIWFSTWRTTIRQNSSTDIPNISAQIWPPSWAASTEPFWYMPKTCKASVGVKALVAITPLVTMSSSSGRYRVGYFKTAINSEVILGWSSSQFQISCCKLLKVFRYKSACLCRK